MPTCVPVIEVTALAVQPVQVPVRFVITPDTGVPSAGPVNVGDVSVGDEAKTTWPVPVAPVAVTPPMEISVPNVCKAVQVFGFARLSEATTDPVVGEMVNVLSELVTELTLPLPPEPQAAPESPRNHELPV